MNIPSCPTKNEGNFSASLPECRLPFPNVPFSSIRETIRQPSFVNFYRFWHLHFSSIHETIRQPSFLIFFRFWHLHFSSIHETIQLSFKEIRLWYLHFSGFDNKSTKSQTSTQKQQFQEVLSSLFLNVPISSIDGTIRNSFMKQDKIC